MKQVYSDSEVRQALKDAEYALRELGISNGKQITNDVKNNNGGFLNALVATFGNEDYYRIRKIERLIKMLNEMYM
jgi:hypothetical protein